MTEVAPRVRPDASKLIMGRYRLDERLGSGGSAEVWRGTDERLQRPVAIKLLHAHLLPDEGARARFEREARAAAALAHPGIVSVFDVDASESGAAIVFELVDGETLADRLARYGALPPPEAARIGAELGEALAHAHERGIVHRDVKPGNVLLERDGRARLVDFGIARLLERESAHLTTAGMITGTLRYLAPEQLAGGEATTSSDLYALGVVLYEMLNGRPPFEAASPVALAEAQQHPPAGIPRVPPPLAAISLEALDPDPAKRPSSAAAMATRLREWAAGPRVPLETATVTAISRPSAAGNDERTVVVPVPAGANRAVSDDGRPRPATSASAVPSSAPAEAAWPLGPGASRRRSRAAGWLRLLAPLVGAAVIVALVAGLVTSGLHVPAGSASQPSPSPAASVSSVSSASPFPAAQPGHRGQPGKKKGRN